jgi:hypothetical protein
MRGAENCGGGRDRPLRERERAAIVANAIQVQSCAIEQADQPWRRVGCVHGRVGERKHVGEQLLAHRPTRRLRQVGRERGIECGEGLRRRGVIVADAGVVARHLREQAVHADRLVLNTREAEAGQRTQRSRQS